MDAREADSRISVRPVHSQNANIPISVTESGSVTVFRFSQRSKAPSPRETSVPGRETSVMPEPSKA